MRREKNRLKPGWLSLKKVTFISILLGLLLAIYLPAMNTMYYSHRKQEFVSHALFAQQFLTARETVLPHIMAHPLLLLNEAAVMVLFNLDARAAGYLLLTLAYLALGLILYAEVLPRMRALSRRGEIWSVAITLVLMLVAQIPILLPLDREIYFGYIGINAYNNATMNYLKPFAMASFLYTLKVFSDTRPSRLDTLISAVLVIASTLVKPNYIICLLPALGLWVLYKLWKRHPIQWPFLILGIGLPALAILGWQYAINYGAGVGEILFDPLKVKYYYSDALIIKFVFSMLFPFLATRVYIRQAVRDDKTVLAWLCFIVGSFYAYFLSETSGGNFTMGNFDWGAEMTLFILFVVVTLFWLERLKENGGWKKRDTFVVLALGAHLIAGILYYLFSLSIDDYSKVASFRRIFDVFLAK